MRHHIFQYNEKGYGQIVFLSDEEYEQLEDLVVANESADEFCESYVYDAGEDCEMFACTCIKDIRANM